MTRASWKCTSTFLLALALPLAAQNGTRNGQVIPSPVGESGSYIVEFRDAPRLASSAATSQRFVAFESDLKRIDASAQIKQRYSRVFSGAAVSASSDAIQRIAALDYVRSVHIDRPMHALLDDSLAKINAPQVWSSFGTRGEGVVVAIVDTGIDYNHPAFGGGIGAGHRVAGGWDFVNNDADPMDDAGHGTHVAGIVGGNGGGVTGIAPGVTFLAYKVLDNQGNGSASVILAGIERAVADHASIVNMSLGGAPVPDDPLVKAVENATAAGVVFAIAAGNNSDFRNISSPALAPSAIAVGATTIDDRIASFSSKGPDANLAIKPEVVAPGVDIVSAKAGGGTLSESGTSMATPHIAGVAALVRAIHPGWTPADVKAAIVDTAVVLGNDVMAEGAGRVDAFAAANADVLASPSTMSFGLDVQSLPHWVATQTLMVVNRGAAPETVQLRASSTRLEVAPSIDATTLTLQPGESHAVHVTIDVDNTALPVPVDGSLAFSGAITIAGGKAPIHVPWAFVRGAQVKLNYDGNEPYEAYISSTHSLVYGHAVADIAQHTATLTIPSGDYDIKLQTFPQRAPDHRLIVLEHQSIDGLLTIPLRRDSASNEIIVAPLDPSGRSIRTAIGGTGSCQDNLVLLWPDGAALSMSTSPKALNEQLLVSPMSDRFTLLVQQFCYSAVTHTVYAAQTMPLHGISGPFTASVDPSLWTHVPLRIAIPASTASVVLSTGFLWRGSNWFFSYLIGGHAPANGGSWNGDLFITRETHPSLNVTAQAEVGSGAAPPTALDSALETGCVRSTDSGFSVWPFLTSSPVTYFAPAGDALSFGEGPPVPLSSIWMEGDNLLTGVRFVGTSDEARNSDASDATRVLRDASGNEVSPDSLVAGAYTFEVTKPLSLFGASGELRMLAAFDTRLIDGAPPSLTAMRVVDASGRITSRIVPNSSASLIFSAIDHAEAPDGIERRAVRADATKIRWRPHGAATWNPLPLTVVGSEIANGQQGFDALGHVPVGTVFRADLSPVTNAGAALIDLSLHVEDAVGNTLDLTVSPALLVSERRRASLP